VIPIRVLIADDHDLLRYGVRAVLERQAGCVVCGEANTGRDAVAKAVDLKPDIVVLDFTMPELNGLEATRQIRGLAAAKVLILTVHESDQIVTEVIEAGAQGYVVKADAWRTLVEAVHTVFAGGTYFTTRVRLAADRRRGPRAGGGVDRRSKRLTPRQREVLQLLTEGRSNKEIGAALGMATKTAETHRAHILAKLNLHSISELVRYAIRNHIIEP
jgi:DNA-binding NarL/FixJ family response regulator